MDVFMIFREGIMAPLSVFDGHHNSRVIELSKEEANKVVEQFNKEEGKKVFFSMSIQEWKDTCKKIKPQENTINAIENVMKKLENDPELNKIRETIYSMKDNYINGIKLPVKVESNEEYILKAKQMLDCFAYQMDKPAFASRGGLAESVKSICEIFKKVLDLAEIEDDASLDKELESTIKEYFYDDFGVSELDKCYAFRGLAPFAELHVPGKEDIYKKMNNGDFELFRARIPKKDETFTMLHELVHQPYNPQGEYGNYRFSNRKYPCFYLGTTSYVCSRECRWNEEKQGLYVSCFKPNEKGKKLKILNLVCSQGLINGLASYRDLQDKMLKVFPLVIVTSFSINNSSQKKLEYSISQSLMRIINHMGIHGVTYLSCQGDDELQYPHGVNLAMPVYDICEGKKFSKLCDCFTMTYPVDVSKLDEDILTCEKTSYINDIYKEKYESGFDDILSTVEYNGEKVFYGKTKFSAWDNCLTNRKFEDYADDK